MMLKIGVTGGIGTGKSLVCRLFALHGIPVYNADDAAKILMNEDAALRNELTAAFGNIYDKDGNLLREEIAKRVFNSPEELKRINNIVHPHVIRHYQEWEQKQNAPYLLRESAILYESGTDKGLDAVIAVSTPRDVRIKRIMERDNRSEQQIADIMQRQMPDEEKNSRADYIVFNDDVQAVLPQVWKLHETFSNGK